MSTGNPIDAAIAQANDQANNTQAAPIPPAQQAPAAGQVVDGFWAVNGQPCPEGTPGAVFTPYQQTLQQAPAQVPAAPVNQMPAAAPVAGMPAVPAGSPMKMEDVQSGITVDEWLTPKETGLLVGKSKTNLFSELLVDIDMTEGEGFFIKMTIKAGNPAQYFSTFDMVSCDKGGTWADAVAKAQALDPNAFEYRSADILLTVVEDAEGSKKESVYQDTELGLTLSTTNWKNWERFYKAVNKAGLMNETVRVKLTAEERNGNGYVWGVVKFELMGAAE